MDGILWLGVDLREELAKEAFGVFLGNELKKRVGCFGLVRIKA